MLCSSSLLDAIARDQIYLTVRSTYCPGLLHEGTLARSIFGYEARGLLRSTVRTIYPELYQILSILDSPPSSTKITCRASRRPAPSHVLSSRGHRIARMWLLTDCRKEKCSSPSWKSWGTRTRPGSPISIPTANQNTRPILFLQLRLNRDPDSDRDQ